MVDDWERNATEKAARFQRMAEWVEQVSITESVANGAGRVTVGHNGLPTNIAMTDGVRSMEPGTPPSERRNWMRLSVQAMETGLADGDLDAREAAVRKANWRRSFRGTATRPTSARRCARTPSPAPASRWWTCRPRRRWPRSGSPQWRTSKRCGACAGPQRDRTRGPDCRPRRR